MADLKAEQILNKFETILTGLVSTGQQVSRDIISDLEATKSLVITQGEDLPIDENAASGFNVTYSRLRVTVTAHVAQSETPITPTLNQIRKEVHIAVMADYTLGLPFVFQTVPSGTGIPDSFGESEIPTARLPIYFDVTYQHSLLDPSA